MPSDNSDNSDNRSRAASDKTGDKQGTRFKPFDPDFGKTGFARRLMRLRFRTLKLSQAAFADRFGLTLGAVKDAEQGRHQPSRALVLLVAAIERDAGFMAGVAAAERPGLDDRPATGHRWAKADGPPFSEPLKYGSVTGGGSGTVDCSTSTIAVDCQP